MQIELPISKSIANRLLVLQAIHGDELMPVSDTFPDDVLLLHRALTDIHRHSPSFTDIHRIDLGNCGTAMRFLTAYCAQLVGRTTILDGVERMHHRPIGQLVEALREMGAQIEYLGKEGFPPLRIKGCALDKHRIVTINNPLSTQYISALLLIGANVITNSTSPYIDITQEVIKQYHLSPFSFHLSVEKDWSSAAFWYEHVALHGGEIHLPGLFRDSLQGDKVVADIFTHLGVQTQYTAEGVTIISTDVADLQRSDLQGIVARSTALRSAEEILHQDFSACPDLYPAVALTCEKLGIQLEATGVESLPLKESDRLRAVREHLTDHDHRMAMALLVAGYPVDNTDCIAKSYPQFLEQWHRIQNSKLSIVIPRKGINDEGKGKKHALYHLIFEAPTEYVWMQDDDITSPSSDIRYSLTEDLYILPLRMESENEHPTLLERLQIAEYAAIQQLTIESAQKGKAVMCSGANLIVRRNRWLESYQDLHPEIPSGDDMFLLESFKRRGLKITVLDDPECEAIVRPHTSWRAFLKQRMRWAGKAPKYTDKDILRCGAIVLGVNLLQLVCPLVLLVKFPIEYRLIRRREKSISFWIALLLEVVYPIYILYTLIGGILRKKW